MKFVLRTLDNLLVERESPEIDEFSCTVMVPMSEPGRLCLNYRRYDKTGEVHFGLPVFREVSELSTKEGAK